MGVYLILAYPLIMAFVFVFIAAYMTSGKYRRSAEADVRKELAKLGVDITKIPISNPPGSKLSRMVFGRKFD